MSLVQFRPEAPRKKEAARRSAGRGRRAAGTKRRCGFSSFGRARPCQGRGSGFEPRNPLQSGGPAPTLPRKGAAIPPLWEKTPFSPFYADVAQVVAHILGKDEVTSSSLVISSKKMSMNGLFKLFMDIFVLFEKISALESESSA